MSALDDVRNWLVSLFIILLMSGGCAVAEIKLNAANDGSQVQATRGQTLVVTLDSNPTTGYKWAVADVDKKVLTQVGDSVYEASNANPKIVGAGGTETFRFQAADAGTTTLALFYRRSWETGVAPIKVFTVKVTVQ